MNKYGPKARATIEKTMREYSDGTLKSGNSDHTVTDRKQAVAIGISKARAEHDKVPKQKG